MFAARQDEEAASPLLVGENLQIRQEIWNALDLVQDGTFTEAGEKAPRIGLCELPLIGRLEIDVGKIRKGLPTDGGLARLTRPGHGHEGILPEETGQTGDNFAFNHGRRLPRYEQIEITTFRLCTSSGGRPYLQVLVQRQHAATPIRGCPSPYLTKCAQLFAVPDGERIAFGNALERPAGGNGWSELRVRSALREGRAPHCVCGCLACTADYSASRTSAYTSNFSASKANG